MERGFLHPERKESAIWAARNAPHISPQGAVCLAEGETDDNEHSLHGHSLRLLVPGTALAGGTRTQKS